MRWIVFLSLMLLATAATPWAAGQYGPQPPQSPGGYERIPALSDLRGTWYMSGDGDQPCQLIPRGPGGRIELINERGDRARGTLRGNRIYVPEWGNLEGSIRGDSIEWSNGTYWSR
jgi:hypothetical protein